MFSQITIFKLAKPLERPSNLILPLEAKYFTPLGQSTQSLSVGFVPPRGGNNLLLETIGGQHILKVAIETKAVPANVIREKAAEQAKAIEEATGRKPGKKERREIQEDVLVSLLPAAFPKRSDVPVWIDRDRGLVIIGSASTSKVDHVTAALVGLSEDLQLQFLSTTKTPRFAMSQWLMVETPDDWPDNFNIGRACELKSDAEDKPTVKFNNHHLMTDEVKQHIREGKMCNALALTWDYKVSFVLTEAMRLKKVQYLDGVMDESGTSENEDRFDADVALATGLLGELLDDLIYALGGDIDAQEGGAA
jgi:recombination associated protein RdgC